MNISHQIEKKIFLTGSTGFIGKYITNYFTNNYVFTKYKRGSLINIQENVVLHSAGKAHDLKNVSTPDDYYIVNTELTKQIFDSFLSSSATVFITFSSVKSVAEFADLELTVSYNPNPKTHYGKSKLLAERYILSKKIPYSKRVYILRPCMIHGPGNKGNLNLLYKIVNKGLPWPLGSFENKRSFCSIDNLCFIINELIENEKIPSGVYNIADDEPISTNELINLISTCLEKKTNIWNIPQSLIKLLSKIGDILMLPLNSERLSKLSETYIVSNKKIKQAINKSLPLTSKDGLIKTIKSYNNNA
jgi:nucleoside-diphosphate-sugar epimerase